MNLTEFSIDGKEILIKILKSRKTGESQTSLRLGTTSFKE